MSGKGWRLSLAAVILTLTLSYLEGAKSSSPVGGEAAYVVSFRIHGSQRCHATLIDDLHVHLPASCVLEISLVNRKFLTVVLGRSQLSETRRVTNYRRNPKWSPRRDHMAEHYNEAVLKLDKPVKIKPVCLSEDVLFQPLTPARIYRFGNITTSTQLPAPKPINVTVTDLEVCKRIYGNVVTGDELFCALADDRQNNLCGGDKGVPLLVKQDDDWVQSATAIIVPKCDKEAKPALFRRQKKQFILQAIEEMMRDPCGIRDLPAGRVMSGEEAAPHSYPWTVAVPYEEELEVSNRTYWLAGALINPYFVATSENWIRPGDEVLLGAHNLSDTSDPGVQRVAIEEVISHPKSANDLASPGLTLLKLARPVTNLRPVCLAVADVTAASSTCTITGWGRTKYPGADNSVLLRETSATIITNDQCRSDFPTSHDTTICTARSESYPSSLSDWGWGGLLQCQKKDVWALFGLNVHSNGTFHPLHTDVAAMVPWVKEILTAHASSQVCFKSFDGASAQSSSSRIVGGEAAEKVPYLASIQRARQHRCHGTLINNQHVFVNAQCLHRVNPKTLKVVLGRTRLSESGGETRGVKDFKVNPKWDPRRGWAHDEAVIKLDAAVSYSEDIKPVCFGDVGSVFPAGTVAGVYGWGKIGTSTSLPPPKPLQGINVTVIDLEECKRIYNYHVTDDMVCAGNMAGGRDICSGDTGAPLEFRQGIDVIQGGSVIMGPRDCGEPNKPAVYWKPATDFITSTLDEMRDPLPECGIRENLPDGLRIVQGQEAAPHSWPWTVYIQGDNGYFWNGGVLLNRYFVATWSARSRDFVVLGAHSMSSTSEDIQKIKVEKVFLHPKHNFPHYGVRLLKLSQPVQFTKNVKPVCLPEPGVLPPAGKKCMVTGWGRSRPGGPTPTDLLQEGSATIITNDQCRRDWPAGPNPDTWITNTTLCTAVTKTRATWGDRGAPLVCESDDSSWTLFGVLAYDGDRRWPSVYHNVTSMLPWVNQIIADQSSQVCFKTFHG